MINECSSIIKVIPLCVVDNVLICSDDELLYYAKSKILKSVWNTMTKEKKKTIGLKLIDIIQTDLGGQIDYICDNGPPNCAGGCSTTEQGLCVNNTIIRHAIFNGEKIENELKSCYYRPYYSQQFRCYYYDTPFELPCYPVIVESIGHSVSGLLIGNDEKNFNDWLFFQYSYNDLKPRPDSMNVPYNTDIGISSNHLVSMTCNGWIYDGYDTIFHIDNNGNVTNIK